MWRVFCLVSAIRLLMHGRLPFGYEMETKPILFDGLMRPKCFTRLHMIDRQSGIENYAFVKAGPRWYRVRLFRKMVGLLITIHQMKIFRAKWKVK